MSQNDKPVQSDGADDEPESEYHDMDEEAFERFLTFAIDGYADIMEMAAKIRTHSEAGVMTKNSGLVVQIGDAEFQITIVRSR